MAFVGTALVSAFLQTAVDRLASRQVVDFFSARKLDEELLNKLKVKLLSIDALADDAELKQLRDPRVREWLFSVKDAVFDAEDLLAEIKYAITKSQVEAQSESKSQTFTHKVSNFFNTTFSSVNKNIVSGMKQVLEKLEFLDNQKVSLGLKESSYYGVGSGNKVSLKLPSSSLVVESDIYGRDDDKEIILNWLTSEAGNHNQLSILSIVGMGGVGKTTLAQHVYYDPRIEEAKFDIKAWVCISDDFDVFMVTKTILEAITNSKDDSGNLEMVHRRLKEKLSGKKFLLVLDDVWNERREEWQVVQTPLNYGAPGSRILVTTRNESVASTMRSYQMHHLRQLQEEQCWKVFAKHAFQDDHRELDAELKEIATKIVEKCKGLPLALKSIGSLLYTKSSISEWESVLLSNIWDLNKENSEIIPALFLSYRHLPSHLKRCFSFCALFPKDYEFDKKELILLWSAQNFLQCPRESNSPKEVGELYFVDLLSRSFFQQSSRNRECFVMHDLLNDLAKYVCGDICFRLGVDKAKGIPKATRHFSFATKDVKYSDDFKSLADAKRLRTLFPIVKGKNSDTLWEFKLSIHELLSEFKFARILSLPGYYCLQELPESVSELKYLCSLDLSHTSIKSLPDSTCLLYNLQILKLNFCSQLEELPSNLHKLTNLHCLEFICTGVRRMPMHFGKLKNLQVLSTFCVGQSSEAGVQLLGGLDLHGELSIEELQNIVNPMDVSAVDLKNNTHLVRLALVWNSKHIPDDPRKDREVLENLQPSKYLKDLSICNYGGTQFPSWLSNDSFLNVVSLSLHDCKYCHVLPPFGLLSSLKELWITGFDGIVSIGAEFYGSSSSSFPSLESLIFCEMKEWEEWKCKVTFPSLQFLGIWECPKLKGLSEQLHLKQLDAYYCGSVKTVSNTSRVELRTHSCPNMNIPVTQCFDFLVKLMIHGSCDSLTTLPLDLFPKLCSLDINSCHNLRMISQEHTHIHLKELKIRDCTQFESFPSNGLSAPKLERFMIEGLENLKSLPKCMHVLLPSLTHLEIRDCPQVEMFPDGDLPSNLKSVHLSNFKLIASLKGTLRANACLDSLCIEKVDVLESFPDEGFLPLSLTCLQIWHCPNIKKLDYRGLCHLPFLESLTLTDCPSLQCLPEEGLPKSISTLTILNCPLLEQRCQKPEGEDWGKIARIQNVDIS